MKHNFILILIIVITIFSCSNCDNYNERKRKAHLEYTEKLTQDSKFIVKKFLNDELEIEQGFDKIIGGFYCMWKRKNLEISPHLALNKLFKESGYNITLSKDSIKYIIVSENKSHEVGKYTNGAKAIQLETIISVIDLKVEKAYVLEKHMGGSSPSSTTSKHIEIGDYWEDKDIYDNIKTKIVKGKFNKTSLSNVISKQIGLLVKYEKYAKTQFNPYDFSWKFIEEYDKSGDIFIISSSKEVIVNNPEKDKEHYKIREIQKGENGFIALTDNKNIIIFAIDYNRIAIGSEGSDIFSMYIFKDVDREIINKELLKIK
jgi:hypothetical protein